MEKWEEIINSIPKCFQDLFYSEFDNNYRTCTSCKDKYPEHRVFFRPIKYKGQMRYYTCRNCMESNLIDKYFEENIPMQTITVYFREALRGKKYCKHCNTIKEHTIENFTHTKSNECRDCLGVKRLETNYFENSKLAKNGLKKCKYCNDIKSLEQFDIHSKVKGNTVSYCKDCKHIYKREKSSYDRNYLKDNLDIKKAYYNHWKENGGIELRRMNNQSREAKKKSLLADLTSTQWEETLKYFNYTCAYCDLSKQEHMDRYDTSLSQDHIIPVTDDGAYSNFNIIPACKSCNSSKNNRELEDFVFNYDVPKEKYLRIIDYIIETT